MIIIIIALCSIEWLPLQHMNECRVVHKNVLTKGYSVLSSTVPLLALTPLLPHCLVTTFTTLVMLFLVQWPSAKYQQGNVSIQWVGIKSNNGWGLHWVY